MSNILKRTIRYIFVLLLLVISAGAVCFAETPPQDDTFTPIEVYVNDEKINDTAYTYKGNIYVNIATIQKYGQTSFITFDTPVDKVYFNAADVNMFLGDEETTNFIKQNAGTMTLQIKYYNKVNHLSLGTISKLCKLDYRYESGKVFIYPQTNDQPNIYREITEKDRFDTKINLIWQTVTPGSVLTSKDGRSFQNCDTVLAPSANEGIDVMAPVWFRTINNGGGAVTNYCDQGYIDLCHANGIKVWSCATNNFDYSGGSKYVNEELLPNESYRNKTVAQMILYTVLFNADGINVDFESMSKSILQNEYNLFIGELYKHCTKLGITLSAATMQASTYWASRYNFEFLGQHLDYVCPMTYNEHWTLSVGPGSTMSRDYYTSMTNNMISYVPREKILMGVPFFTQVWQVSTSWEPKYLWAVNSRRAIELITDNNCVPVWDEPTGQYIAVYPTNKGAGPDLVMIWPEDTRSMAQKVKYVLQSGIAGTACWAKGQEYSELLDVFGLVYKHNIDPDTIPGYWQADAPEPQPLPPKFSKGDANGDGAIDANDITDLSRHIAKISDIEDDDMILAADVDGSGEVDANDLTLLSRYVAKIIDSFDQADEQPAEQTQHGGTSSDPQPSSEPQTQEDPVYAANGYLKGIKASEYVTVADPASISVTKAEIDAAVKEMLANLTDDGNVPAWTDDFVKTAFYNVYGWSTTSEAEAGIAATLAHSKYVSAASWLKDVPAELVTDTYNELVANAEAEVAAQGKDLDSYAAELGLGSADELKQLYKLQAEANVKVTFIYQALAERNGYEPTEADIRAYFNNNTGSEDYSAYEADYGLPYIKAVVLSDKMEELIITSATIGS